MKEMWLFCKNNKNAKSLFIFNLVFFTGMCASTLVHPIWFKENNSLPYFGYAYSAMAFTGFLGLWIGRLLDSGSPTKFIKTGILIYCVGLALRIYTHSSTVAVFSGIACGVGAGTVLVSIYPWILSWVKDDSERIKTISLNIGSTTMGAILGSFLGGAIPKLFPSSEIGYLSVLLISPIIVFCALSIIPATKKVKEKKDSPSLIHIHQELLCFPVLSLCILIVGFLNGFQNSFVTPYLSVFLTSSYGVDIAVVGGIIAGARLIQSLFSFWSGKFINSKRSFSLFILGEVGIALFTFLMCFLLHPTIFVALLVFRFVLIALGRVCEKDIFSRFIPKEKTGLFFGLMQTAFLAGDGIGAIVGVKSYSLLGLSSLFVWASIAIAANTLIFAFFYMRLSKKPPLYES